MFFHALNIVLAIAAYILAALLVPESVIFLVAVTGATFLIMLRIVGSITGGQAWVGIASWVVVGLVFASSPGLVNVPQPADTGEEQTDAEASTEEGTPGATIQSFYDAINDGNYPLAYTKWTRKFREETPEEEFLRSFQTTTTIKNLEVELLDDENPPFQTFRVTFDEIERTAQGIDTTKRTWDFVMVDENGEWKISDATQR